MAHVQMTHKETGEVWACPEGYVDRAKERGWKRATKSDLEVEDATETAPPQRRTTASKPSKK